MNKNSLLAALINAFAAGICSMAVLINIAGNHTIAAVLNTILVAFNSWLTYVNYKRGTGQ